jgi:hypothetical protein
MKNSSNIVNAIEKLHQRILDFNIAKGTDRGGIRYHNSLDTACTWCTMFTTQALRFWTKRKEFEETNNKLNGWTTMFNQIYLD